jgi:hypothetical protein
VSFCKINSACLDIAIPLACRSSNTVRDTFLIRILTIDENNLLQLMLEDAKSGYRAKIILLKDEGYTVPQIRKITNHHDYNIRKWVHRFNEKGIDGIIKKNNRKQY